VQARATCHRGCHARLLLQQLVHAAGGRATGAWPPPDSIATANHRRTGRARAFV
jgi:hypothetical protein